MNDDVFKRNVDSKGWESVYPAPPIEVSVAPSAKNTE
ncbi:MAG: hypothetical protein Ct9H90mP18_03180 [Gammaproteobacteria bacterium]|nr:MAG: hypothetical protein Ct9H90mP18_03180 [Gammaproteobacteria bacterium]